MPLVTEAFDWAHGVFLGSVMSSEKTAAAAGTAGGVRFDPFAMVPFMGWVSGEADAVDTPIGCVPAAGAFDVAGLDLDHRTLRRLLAVDPTAWCNEVPIIGVTSAR